MLENNNKVMLSGYIEGKFEFDHELYGEKFFRTRIVVERLSGVQDFIPIMTSERMIDVEEYWSGKKVRVIGQIRSYNKYDNEGKTKLLIYVFLHEIELGHSDDYYANEVYLEGYLCKEPSYRRTPLGRELSDVIMAVNRSYRKSDYIPCICLGRNAKFVSGLSVGTKVKLWGRFQSRNYIKKISDTESENRTAYEVSISKLDVEEEHEETED